MTIGNIRTGSPWSGKKEWIFKCFDSFIVDAPTGLRTTELSKSGILGIPDQRTKWYRPSQVNTPAGSELKSDDTRTLARSPASAPVPPVSTQVPTKVL